MVKLPSFIFSKKFLKSIEWIGYIIMLISGYIATKNSAPISSTSTQLMFLGAGITILFIIIRKIFEKKGILKK